MVRMKSRGPEARTIYHFKPGQTLENTKPSERALALLVPRPIYERFTDYANESEKVALLAEREAKRLAALKEATYNMSKTWQDTSENIQKRRKEELLSRKKVEEAERIKFAKDMAAKKALERAEVVKQAKELILYRKPGCRMINRSLLSSECLRELNEQVKFQRTLKDVLKKFEEDQARKVLEDVEKFHEEEKKKREAKLNKIRINKEELENQIEHNKRYLNKLEDSIRKCELNDLHNMTKEIEDIQKKELEEALQKKEALRKMFLEAIEEKRQYELKIQQEDEFQEKNLKIYREMKEQMEQIAKQKAKNVKVEKTRKIEALAKKMGESIERKHRTAEKRDLKKKEAEEREMEEKRKKEELDRAEERKRKREKARAETQKQLRDLEEEQEKRRKEEEEIRLWETLQRYKRDEFNKDWNAKRQEEDKNQRLNYGKILKKQMAQKDAERRQARIEADDSVDVKEMINKANEKVLAYGESVLQESRGVRPIFPIEKVIEQFKRDVGLTPPAKAQQDYEMSEAPKRRRGKRPGCTKPVSEDSIFSLG